MKKGYLMNSLRFPCSNCAASCKGKYIAGSYMILHSYNPMPTYVQCEKTLESAEKSCKILNDHEETNGRGRPYMITQGV